MKLTNRKLLLQTNYKKEVNTNKMTTGLLQQALVAMLRMRKTALAIVHLWSAMITESVEGVEVIPICQ